MLPDNSNEESSLWEHLKYFNDAFTKLHSESLSLFGAIVRSIQRNSQKIKTLEHNEMEQQEDENGTMNDGVEIDYQDNGSYPSTHSLPTGKGKTYCYVYHNIKMDDNKYGIVFK